MRKSDDYKLWTVDTFSFSCKRALPSYGVELLSDFLFAVFCFIFLKKFFFFFQFGSSELGACSWKLKTHDIFCSLNIQFLCSSLYPGSHVPKFIYHSNNNKITHSSVWLRMKFKKKTANSSMVHFDVSSFCVKDKKRKKCNLMKRFSQIKMI